MRTLCLLLLSGLVAAAHAAPTLQLEKTPDGTWQVRLKDAKEAVAFFVDSVDASLPPLLGNLSTQGEDRLFRPRFPLQPGLTYRATFATRPPTILTFSLPSVAPLASTRVNAVYPSADLLPENQLKFYIQFSASMGRGDAYRWIRLLDERGQAIDVPFLELGEELWDPENKRLTLYFDPGRVKSDLLPGREMGAPLRNGRRYTLVLDAGWPDAQGKPLANEHRKPFAVGPADHEPSNPKHWTLRAPVASTRDAVAVEFPEPLDRALLLRMIEVIDSRGNRVAGSIDIERNETRWLFVPTKPWNAGAYALRANTALEDLAGNKLNRPFEFEGVRTPAQRVSAETVTLPFTVDPPRR
jgi:hypothetical protein